MAYTKYAVEQIKALCNIPSPTGFTRKVTDYLLDTLQGMGYAPVRTVKGTVFCELCGEGAPLMVAAHVDTLGAMVRSVKGNGKLRFSQVGGYSASTVENENCLIHTRDGKVYQGTVQSIHASRHVWGDTGKEPHTTDTTEIVIDEDVKDAKGVKALGISAGDFISWDPRTLVTESGYIKSRHLDDKASSGILLSLAKAVKEGAVTLSRKVTIMFTVYEEEGHGASSLITNDILDFLAVDMGCVGDDLGCTETQVSICAKDSASAYNYDLTNQLIGLAKAGSLDYVVDVYPMYSSDTATALRAGLDARHALIGPGVFASHGYERTHIKGVDATLKLVFALVQAPPCPV